MCEKRLYEILVPCNWNGGKPVRTRHHREWDKRVKRISGGLTILRPCKGSWVHEGAVYDDRVIPVRIMCTDSEMKDIARITIEHYEQEAVMYYIISDWCLIVPATDAQRGKFLHQRNTIAKEFSNAYSAG